MTRKIMIMAVLIQFGSIVYAQKAPQTIVEQGTLEGLILQSGIKTYRGVPFAQPPVGKLRWREPQPALKWNGIRKAREFGPNAMQKNIFGDMMFRASKMSEDCLYLNVWTPAVNNKEKLPVLVYFYGGGYIAGDGSESRYDGETLAKKGIVVVTLNYRLGIFGFFAHPELTKESPNHASGNYGLLDQNAAIAWVKKNITAFGGDPNKITIAGESAGSISVSAQMASPLSKNLISGAIGQSGAMINPTFDAIPLAEQEQNGVKFGTGNKADNIEALRAIPSEKLLDLASVPGAFSTKAVIDGYFLPKWPVEIFAAGEQANVPLLAGWTSTEMPYQVFMKGQYPSPENYTKLVQEKYGNNAEILFELYPGADEKEVIESATALSGDNFIVYSTWKWLDLHRTTTTQPVYAYIFSKPRPPMKAEMGNAKAGLAGGVIKDDGKKDNDKKEGNKLPEALTGAPHASDIEYLLGNLSGNKVYEWTADDYKVSEIGVEYFANFIKTGNPNGKKMVNWPVNSNQGEMNIMEINIQPKTYKEPHRDRYLFLDKQYRKK